jgi:hypothetical protein
MNRLLIIAACAALLTAATAALAGCGSNAETPEAKVDAAIARLGADPATMAQQKVVDVNFGPADQVLNRTIYLVPKKDSKDLWIIDSDGEIHDGYYAFLRDNNLTR